MDIRSSPIPQISISLAPPEETPAEPYSPFANTTFNRAQEPEDAFRPLHLTPPPTHTKFIRQQSPLRLSYGSPVENPKQTGQGLDRARFEALLNACKEKPQSLKKDATDLRKEVAMKAHKSRQADRRALFLSKVLAPPSPTAAVTPKTPPESPAIFHYTLPSPGLVSPIAHYESLHDHDNRDGISPYTCQPWVEQVDFKLLSKPKPRVRASKTLPSLEQISAHFKREGQQPILNSRIAQTAQPAVSEQPPRLVVGRLRLPVRRSATAPVIKVSLFPEDEEDQREEYVPSTAPPKSPLLTTPSDLQVTTLVVPRTQSVSPTELTKVNLLALNSRETRSSTMLNTLRRRTQSSSFYTRPTPSPEEVDPRKGFRRRSAPPDLSNKARSGFEHPILRLPGAF